MCYALLSREQTALKTGAKNTKRHVKVLKASIPQTELELVLVGGPVLRSNNALFIFLSRAHIERKVSCKKKKKKN